MSTGTLSRKSIKTKFRLADGVQPLILLPVHVNGRGPYDFIFDTGAGTSLLSLELAKEIDAEILGSKDGHSAGGKVSVSLAKVQSLGVGGIEVNDVDVGIVDLAHIGKTLGAKIYGDLGYNFFSRFRVTIDYQRSEIRFDDPQRFEAAGRASARTEVPIRLANPAKPLILVDVCANGSGPFQFAIDTGTSMTAITPEMAGKLGLPSSPIGAGTMAHMGVPVGEVKSFQVGGARIDNMAVVVADFFAMLSKAVGTNLDGIVGYNFLRQFKVVIDYPNERLSLF